MTPEKYLPSTDIVEEEKDITLVDCYTFFQDILTGNMQHIGRYTEGLRQQLFNSVYRVITDPSLTENIYSFIAQVVSVSNAIVRETFFLKTAMILVQKGYVEEGKKIMVLIPEGTPGKNMVMSYIHNYNQRIEQII